MTTSTTDGDDAGKKAAKPAFPKPRVRLSRPDSNDLASAWWLERTSGKEDIFPYRLLEHYVNRSKPDRFTLVLEAISPSPKKVVGFVCFRQGKIMYHAVSCVVHPDYRRRGYGGRLMRVIGRLPKPFPRLNTVTCAVRESDLPTQLWLKSAGFRCPGILPGVFDCPPDNAYQFFYEAPLVASDP